MSIESGYTVTLTVYKPAGQPNVVLEMETWSGGNLSGPGTKHRNPVTRKQTARGGLPSRDDLTLTRECDAEAWTHQDALEDAVERDRATATRQMVGPRGEAIGEASSVTGLVQAVNFPDSDLNGEETAMLEIVISTDE